MRIYQLFIGTEQDKDGKPITDLNRETARTQIESLLCDRFGGCTIVEGVGLWCPAPGQAIVRERCLVITVAVGTRNTHYAVKDVAAHCGRLFHQYSVLLASNMGDSKVIGAATDDISDWDSEVHP